MASQANAGITETSEDHMSTYDIYCHINGPGPHECESCCNTMDEGSCHETRTGFHCGCRVEDCGYDADEESERRQMQGGDLW